MFKSAMGYLGGVASSAMSTAVSDGIPTLDAPEDALVGSVVDVGGQKVIVKKRIGEGGFAFVYCVEDVQDSSKKYALKRLLAMDSEKKNLIIKEISLMKSLSGHSNVVKFISAAEAKGVNQRGCDEFLVLMEFCPTNLSEIMSKRNCKCYPPSTVAKIFAQITSAVAKMHRSSPPIVHRDLKLENLLVDDTGNNVKLCDFGSATTEIFSPNESWSMSQRTNLEEEMAKHTTPMYRAPEMLDTWSNYSIHTASDIWALGCLLYFLCFGRHPFEDSAKLAIINGNYRIPENDVIYVNFHDLIRQMLVVDPSFRPSINQVQEHLASVSGFDLNEPLNLELEKLVQVKESVSNESLQSFQDTNQNQAPGFMSNLRGGAGSFMGKIRDTSKAVIQTVQHSMASRDLDLHLITEKIGAMSYPAEGLESAMRNHIDDIAGILENRHSNHYSVINLTERTYNVAKFSTGIVSQPGWQSSKPTSFKLVLETINLCLDFLKRDSSNVIVIHCMDGKSNTAVLIIGLLMACGFVNNYKDGLRFFALKRCEALLKPHHKIMLRYLESAFSGPSSLIESRVVTVTSVVLEPVPGFSKTAEGCRPFIEVTKADSQTQSPLKVAPSSDYASLTFFSSYDEEAILKVNAKTDGDVIISVFHARQTNMLFTNKFDKILICRLYFHTGFLGGNSSSLRFRLKDLEFNGNDNEKFATDFKVVVNFRPEKEIKALPLKCKNADLSLLFGTRDEMVNNREMMGSQKSSTFDDSPQNPTPPPRTKSRQSPASTTVSDDILISPMGPAEESSPKLSQTPTVPQPVGQNKDILLDFGASKNDPFDAPKNDPFSGPKDDLFSDFTAPPPPKNASSSNIDSLLDISDTSSSSNLMNPMMNMMKTSSSAENFKSDPFGDLLGGGIPQAKIQQPKIPQPTVQPPKSAADDLVSKMLNDLDMKPTSNAKSNAKPTLHQQTSSKPNYNISFAATTNKNGISNPNSGSQKVSSNTFEDLLGPGFLGPAGNGNGNNSNKSIGEMKKAETMKTMTPEEAKVFAWKDGKSRNLRALLCSLHTVIWANSRWTQCGMHQLVQHSDVHKMYRKACLAVHPDKQMGGENEELSKLIFIELNDAWAEFNKDN